MKELFLLKRAYKDILWYYEAINLTRLKNPSSEMQQFSNVGLIADA